MKAILARYIYKTMFDNAPAKTYKFIKKATNFTMVL